MTIGGEGEMVFWIKALDPSGAPTDVRFVLAAPVEETPSGCSDYVCAYRLDPPGWSGQASGTNPLHAIRLALFKARVELVHRLVDWRFTYPDGTLMSLDYDESA